MSSPHANHQGEPGDTGTGVLRSQDDLRAAYDAGFEASGEGWNGECPAGVMEDAGYKMRRAQWIAHFILEAPMPADGGLHAEPGHIPMPRNADEAKAMWLLGEHWVRAHAPELIASAPTPPDRVGEEVGRDHVVSARLIPWEPDSLGGVDLTFESGLRVALPLSEPEATPKSSPDQTPVDPQMTVEEAKEVLRRVQCFAADMTKYASALRNIGRNRRADQIEAALRTLQAAGEVRDA